VRRNRVLLISPPWRLLAWPSLAVGVLKAHLTRLGIPVDGLHLHLDVALRIGPARYEQIAQGWELGEALYFALQCPDERSAILGRVAEILRRQHQDELADWAINGAVDDVERATAATLDQLALDSYGLVGLSVGALQFGASVYLAQELKRRAPHLRVVLGGPSLIGEVGGNLLRRLPFVDAIVDGEGERALAALAGLSEWAAPQLAAIPNLVYRTAAGDVAHSASSTTRNLDDAPVPDMDEFYAAARAAGYPRSGLVLPIEASRGCAWEHRKDDGKLRGCTFCGLYRSSPDYREKGLAAVMADMRAGVERSQVLDVSFIDAYLPSSYSKELLRQVAASDLDLTLFCEMRCDLDPEIAHLMSLAGVRRVQLGVESFHTRILSRMAKGTRMIDNISSIKLCEEFGIPFQYNVILRFPGVPVRHIQEMADLLPSLRGFRPPTVADFYLDRGSRIFQQPTRFGIAPETLDRQPLPFLPTALVGDPVSQFVSFDWTDGDESTAAWQQVADAVAAWQARSQTMRALGVGALLSYRQAGERLYIEDLRQQETRTLELRGNLRKVLLASDRLTDRATLHASLPELSQAEIEACIAELQAHRLVVQEGSLVLALPMRSRLPSGARRQAASPASATP
jgi:ribosomal peptide maturation radical SAM protein 1